LEGFTLLKNTVNILDNLESLKTRVFLNITNYYVHPTWLRQHKQVRHIKKLCCWWCK